MMTKSLISYTATPVNGADDKNQAFAVEVDVKPTLITGGLLMKVLLLIKQLTFKSKVDLKTL